MLRHTRRRLMHRISKLELRLGIRLAVAAVLAMVAGRMLGLHAFYWAGISAIVVSTGTPGGSTRASLRRIGGTLVGLLVGALLVTIAGHTLQAAAGAILVAIFICQLVGLKAAVRLAALSTLFPVMLTAETHGHSATLDMVVSRSLNVLVGCGVTLLIDVWIWPERVSAKVLDRLRKDLNRVGNLAGDLLDAYVEGQNRTFEAVLLDLQRTRLTYGERLKEVGFDAEEGDLSRETLAFQAEGLHQLVDHCAALRDIQRSASGDQAPALLRKELDTLGRAIRETAAAFGSEGFEAALEGLRGAGLALETAYDGVRGVKGTQDYPSQEVFRLLGVLYLCGALVRGLDQMVPGEPEAADGEA